MKDSAGNTYSLAIGPTSGTGIAAVDLLRGQHRGRQQHGDGDLQPGGSLSGCAHPGVPGSDGAGCDGRSQREQHQCQQRCGDDDQRERADLRSRLCVATLTKAAGSGFTSRIITLTGRRYRRRQDGDSGGQQQRHGDVVRLRPVGDADGDLRGGIRSGADGDQCEPEQRFDRRAGRR